MDEIRSHMAFLLGGTSQRVIAGRELKGACIRYDFHMAFHSKDMVSAFLHVIARHG